MNKRNIALISLLILSIFFSIWFWYVKSGTDTKISLVQNQEDKSGQISQSVPQNLIDYPIPELGIKLKLPKDIAENLVYEMTGKETVGFSKKLLVEFSADCAPKWGVLGGISRYEGKPEDYPGPFVHRERGRKVFDSFFIVYSPPQAWCLSDKEAQRYTEMLKKNGGSKESYYQTDGGIRFEDIIPFTEKL